MTIASSPHVSRNVQQRSRLLSTIVATMSSEEVAKHPHFRLKVDLSRFFHDARQYSWIFVDRTRLQRVTHIEQHIAKLFDIAEPFHLLLNDTEYLPPTEDTRILEKNETIRVVPGSGIDASNINTTKTLDRVKVSNNTSCDTSTVSNNISINNTDNINNTTTDMMFYSMMEDTEVDNESSKSTDNNLTDNCNNTENNSGENFFVSGTKRKRVRKRKPKNRSQEHSFLSPLPVNEESKSKKPKIIESYIIPPAKITWYENLENSIAKNENSIAKKIVQEMSRSDSCTKDSSSDLSVLLALGKSSTPMFVKKRKLKNEANADSASSDETRNKGSCKTKEIDDSTEKNTSDTKTERKGYYKNIELKSLPQMMRKPQVKDTIAFKILKIGADYTPQVSEFIVTDVVDFCDQTGNYTLRVLDGKDEIQVPLGKFSLSEDEDETTCPAETFVLNYKQMKTPRLIV